LATLLNEHRDAGARAAQARDRRKAEVKGARMFGECRSRGACVRALVLFVRARVV
jgi:hypothetical protein